MTDTTPKTEDRIQAPAPLPEGIPAPQPAPPKPKRSPFMKKLLTELGGVIDLAGRGAVAVAFAAQFVKPQTLPTPGAGVIAIVGVFLVIFGIYLKAEAER